MSKLIPKYLIIIADDFGYSTERDDGIIECYKQRAISGVSLMVNGHSAVEAVKKASALKLPTDLHLNLTEGLPISTRECNSLTGVDGFMLGKMGFRQAVKKGIVDLLEVKNEIQAQIDKFKELTGHYPIKVDGHQHIHVIPGVCKVFSEVLQDNGIKMSRLPIEEGISSHTWSSIQQQQFMEGIIQQSKIATELFASHGIWCPGFVGLKTMGRDMSLPKLQSSIVKTLLKQCEILSKECLDSKAMGRRQEMNSSTELPYKTSILSSASEACFSAKEIQPVADDTVCELMVHPGYRTLDTGGCGNGPDQFAKSEDREHEMATLMSVKMFHFYEENNILLISFSDCMSKMI